MFHCWNNYPKSWKVSVWERKTRIHFLLVRMLASCQIRHFLREFTENCFAIFDQSNCMFNLTWYELLLFFSEFFTIIPFMVWFQDSMPLLHLSLETTYRLIHLRHFFTILLYLYYTIILYYTFILHNITQFGLTWSFFLESLFANLWDSFPCVVWCFVSFLF